MGSDHMQCLQMYGPELRDSYITAPQTPLSVPQLTPPGRLKVLVLVFFLLSVKDSFVSRYFFYEACQGSNEPLIHLLISALCISFACLHRLLPHLSFFLHFSLFIYSLKAKFHYAIWSQRSPKLVADLQRAGIWPIISLAGLQRICDQPRTCLR